MTLSTSDMQERVRQEVAMPSRLRHAALLTTSLIVGVGVASLLATEPALPPRTQWAFGGIVVIAAGWAVYATWVLTHRRVLFGRQRVAAARMACLFTFLAFGGSVLVREQVGIGGIVSSGLLLFGAVALLMGAHRNVRRLSTLAKDIERHTNRPGVGR